MKPQNSNSEDEALSHVLQEWKVGESLPPQFQDGVWHRIQRNELREPIWLRLVSRLNVAISRPALATGYLAVLLLAGIVAGYWQAHVANAHAEEQLSTLYVQSVDPYQMPHH